MFTNIKYLLTGAAITLTVIGMIIPLGYTLVTVASYLGGITAGMWIGDAFGGKRR